jgi:hypothetical protein
VGRRYNRREKETFEFFGHTGTARALTVPVLPREQAVKLLLDVTQQPDEATAGAIAQTLGDLPLALAQAAAYIDATGLSLHAYVQQLQTHLETLLRRGAGSPEYPATVATTWTMAFDALQEAQPAALSLLKLCAFFPRTISPRRWCASTGLRYLHLWAPWSPMTSNGTRPSWPCDTMPSLKEDSRPWQCIGSSKRLPATSCQSTSAPNGRKPRSSAWRRPFRFQDHGLLGSHGRGRPVHGICRMRWPWSAMSAIRAVPRRKPHGF